MKGIDFINKSIAANKNLPFKLVERVNRYYWKQGIKRKLANLEVDAIYVKNFGTFRVSNHKIRNHILLTIAKIRSISVSIKYKETTKVIRLAKLREILTLLLQRRNILAKQYYEQNRRVDKANTESYCESGENSRRNIQLDSTSFGYPA